MTKFECWEFKGTGDAFFGGTADDRILRCLPGGELRFIRGCDAQRLGAPIAEFDTQEEAETAGIRATERNGLISAHRR